MSSQLLQSFEIIILWSKTNEGEYLYNKANLSSHIHLIKNMPNTQIISAKIDTQF